MLAVACLAALALAAPSVASHTGLAGAKLDMALERTPILVEQHYTHLPGVGREGAMGGNLGDGSEFSIADQHLGDLYVRAGLVHGDPALIEEGLRAFDYGFAHQSPDGSFGAIQTEEYAFFVQAVAHSVLLLRQSPYRADYAAKLRGYVTGIGRAAPHMIDPTAWAEFRTRNRSYTHTGYRVGTALALTGRLAGEPKYERKGRAAIDLSLRRQLASGANPELGGYDVRYHMVGLGYAQRYAVYFPGGDLTRRIRRMTGLALKWMSTRIDGDGWIDYRGSTRACVENSSLGVPKTPGYDDSIRGYAYWGALKHREALVGSAERLKSYLRNREGDGSLCGPKQTVSTP